MTSTIQPNMFTIRDTHLNIDRPTTAARNAGSSRGLGARTWTHLPDIWQTGAREHTESRDGGRQPVSPAKSDSLTTARPPPTTTAPGARDDAASLATYPLRPATSSVMPAPSSIVRNPSSSRSPKRPGPQRASGALTDADADTDTTMPHLGTATLLNGSAPDIDITPSATTVNIAAAGNGQSRSWNISDIDEFVPAYLRSHSPEGPRRIYFGLGTELPYGPTTGFDVDGRTFGPHLRYSQDHAVHAGVQHLPGNAMATFYPPAGHTGIGNYAGGHGLTYGSVDHHRQDMDQLAMSISNMRVERSRDPTSNSRRGTINMVRNPLEPQTMSTVLDAAVNATQPVLSTPLLHHQTTHADHPTTGPLRGTPGSATTDVYTPSRSPPTGPGSRRSNSGSGTSTGTSNQSVDLKFGGFENGTQVVSGRLHAYPGQAPHVGFNLLHQFPAPPHSTLPLPPATIAPGRGEPTRHHLSNEARIQQEKEQNLSPLIKDFRANYKTKRYELKDAYHHVVEFSGDQHGSRFIQAKLETANSDEKEIVFNEIQENALQLMTDIFGNYVIQKMFEHGTQAQKKILANQMKGRIHYLTTQVYGCRVVQKALEHVLTDQQASMVKELEGNVLSIVENQNGNHVIQKAIERVPSEHIQFIFEAHKGHVVRLSKHNYGCRVIQRMLEHGPLSVRHSVLGELRESIPTLIEDQFGNYVIQHIIRNGERADRHMVVGIILRQLLHFSKHKFASNVVEAAIEGAEESQRREMLHTLTTGTDAYGQSQVYGLIRDQYGNYVIQKVLAKLQGAALNDLVVEIQQHLTMLRKISHGKQVSAMEKALADAIARLGAEYRGPIPYAVASGSGFTARGSGFGGAAHHRQHSSVPRVSTHPPPQRQYWPVA